MARKANKVQFVSKEQEFNAWRERIEKELFHAKVFFEMWKRLSACQNDYLEEMNRAPGFFSATMNAHLGAALMCMFKLLEKKDDRTVSIWSFLQFVSDNLEMFSEEAFSHRVDGGWKRPLQPSPQTVADDMSEIKKLPLKELMIWRNNYYVHLNREFALGGANVQQQYPIQIAQFESAVDALSQVLNKYSVAFDGKEYALNVPDLHNIDGVLKAIRFEMNAKRLLSRSEFGRLRQEVPSTN